jgi:hypothetical protein
MDNGEPSSTSAPADQQNFTDLSLYQQVYITDLVLGAAAAVTLAAGRGSISLNTSGGASR